MSLQVHARFRDPKLGIHDYAQALRRMAKVIEVLERRYPEHDRTKWRLQGDTEQMAKLFPVFDADGPSRVALAVLEQEFRNEDERTFVAIWDGLQAPRVDASMACHMAPPEYTHSLDIELDSRSGAIDAQLLLDVLRPVVEQFDPLWIEVFPFGYSEQVFPDKPGVAWMLYLPLEITAQQVPEAAALVPMAGRDGRRRGTVVLSVVDEVFDGQDPRHIEAAANIDIRMVDQDLMPCYSDLWPAA
jgi:hypothetical protein